jgi:hypothetical protein
MNSTHVLAMRKLGIKDTGIYGILLFLHENSRTTDEELAHCGLPVWEIAQRTGLSQDQVKRAMRALSECGAIARGQLVKQKGEAAVTVLTDRAMTWLGSEGQGVIPADMPRQLRELLVFESRAFVAEVAEAWRQYAPLPERLREECTCGASYFGQIEAAVRQRLLDAAESVAVAHAEERADRDQLAKGVVQFDCEDGTVAFDSQILKAQGGAVGGIDLCLVRDVVRRVRERRPGLVTVARLPTLVAELGYSRTLGFVARHDAEDALRVLVATMSKESWSRPKGIRPAFYQQVACAGRLSTGVREARC